MIDLSLSVNLALMQFSFTVRVADGSPSVTSWEGVPDGVYTVQGDDTPGRESLHADRHGLDGRFVVRASHVHEGKSQ